jgi:hypothetical protein
LVGEAELSIEAGTRGLLGEEGVSFTGRFLKRRGKRKEEKATRHVFLIR